MRPDPAVVETFLRYARLLAARGYVHNTLGNIVLRAAHPDFPHGIAYTKHAELSLEEMTADNIVITDIPTSRVLYGGRTTSIGHNLSREILRLRPDIHATIHVHDDALIAFLACGAHPQIGMLSLDPPFVLGKPIHYVEAHVDVEADVSSVKDFIQNTNSVRRNITAELLAAAAGTRPAYRSEAEVQAMYRHAEAIIYPKRAERVMQED